MTLDKGAELIVDHSRYTLLPRISDLPPQGPKQKSKVREAGAHLYTRGNAYEMFADARDSIKASITSQAGLNLYRKSTHGRVAIHSSIRMKHNKKNRIIAHVNVK